MDIKFEMAFVQALEERVQQITPDIEALRMQGREDEANLKKVARNIYGLAAELIRKEAGGAAYEAQLEQLRNGWQMARDTAAMHGDHDRLAIEETKLAALREVWDIYMALQEEVH